MGSAACARGSAIRWALFFTMPGNGKRQAPPCVQPAQTHVLHFLEPASNTTTAMGSVVKFCWYGRFLTRQAAGASAESRSRAASRSATALSRRRDGKSPVLIQQRAHWRDRIFSGRAPARHCATELEPLSVPILPQRRSRSRLANMG